jgi:G:T-mismatch repair DNA endonuclease (very short patch repair protein)
MDYIKFFKENNKSGWKSNEKKLKNNHPDIWLKVNEFAINHNLINLKFKVKVWHFLYGITTIPKCPTCGKDLKFIGNLFQGYQKHCSIKCSRNNPETIKKQIETNNKVYGVDVPTQSEIVKEKFRKTCLNKYGVDNVSKVPDIQKKREKTTLKNHGVKSFLETEEAKIALSKYSKLNFGVDHISKSNEIKEKKRKTAIKNYGFDSPMKSDIVKTKLKNTINKKYGVDNPMYIEDIKNKCTSNMIKSKYEKFISKFELKDTVINWSGTSVTLNCSKCKQDYSLSRELLTLRYNNNRDLCVNCNPLYNKDISYLEGDLKNFMTSLGVKFKPNDRTILDGKELDIYIPDHKLAIELDGLYWHSELFTNKNYHLEKTKKCESKGIQLIHIFEDEWVYKQDIVKSRLKNLLGLTENRIYARKCNIRELNVQLAKDFCNRNHLQGYSKAKYKLGLFDNNELVSVMLFNKTRIAMGGDGSSIELIRFCNKLNTNVIGGASKLLKYFIKQYKPKELISYADRRWSNGSLYDSIGFDKVQESSPSYWYIINNLRHHRFNYRKSKLVKEGYPKELTEHEIMLSRNIYRIFDCGTIKFKFKD